MLSVIGGLAIMLGSSPVARSNSKSSRSVDSGAGRDVHCDD